MHPVLLDFGDMLKANATGYFPYTPSLPMLYGMREAVTMLFEEGLDNVYARHHRLAEGCRRAVTAWGLTLCARDPKWYSDTVSAIMVPGGFNGADVIDVAYRRYNFALGAGLNKVAGKLFRIGHLGDLNELTLMAGIAGAEMAMRDVGIKVKLGSGVAAARQYWPRPRPRFPPKKGTVPAKSAVAKKPLGVAMSHTRYDPARPRLQRSELAVPGSNPAMFAKALDERGGLRLPRSRGRRGSGRQGAGAYQRDRRPCNKYDWRGHGKTICVRVNGIDTHYYYRDMVDVVEQAGHKLDVILVPKVGVPADVYLTDALLTQIETAKGIRAPDRHRRADRDGTRHGERRGHRPVELAALEAMHFGVADYAASLRARTVSIGGLNPDYPGDQWHAGLCANDRGLPGLRPAADRRPLRGLQGSRRLPLGRDAEAPRSASRGSGRFIRRRSHWPTRSSRRPEAEVDRAEADSGGAGAGGPGREGRRAARRQDDRCGERPHGAERR